jgi:Anti-sigma-28 factor, FlgM
VSYYVWSILTTQCYIYFAMPSGLATLSKRRAEVYMWQIDPHEELSDAERERLDAIRTAVAAGTYYVSAEAIASKIIEDMLDPGIAVGARYKRLFRNTREGFASSPEGRQIRMNHES